MIQITSTITLWSFALGSDWWTTGAPQEYQCVLSFVPADVLSRASGYTEIFLNSLTAESPDYWGSMYGNGMYDAQCHPSTTADYPHVLPSPTQGAGADSDLTTTLTATELVTKTAQNSSPTSTDDLTTTLTATEDVTRTTTLLTKLGTPEAISEEPVIVTVTESPITVVESLVFFTRTPERQTYRYTSSWQNSSQAHTMSWSNATSSFSSNATSPGVSVLPTPIAPTSTSTSLVYTTSWLNTTDIPSPESTTLTETLNATSQISSDVHTTSYLTTVITIVDGTTLSPSPSATPYNKPQVNTQLPNNPEIGSDPFGSNPFGSDPFGAHPFGGVVSMKS